MLKGLDASKFASNVLSGLALTLISTLYENEFHCQTLKIIRNILLMDTAILDLDNVTNYTL